jgi:hypothetical protein
MKNGASGHRFCWALLFHLVKISPGFFTLALQTVVIARANSAVEQVQNDAFEARSTT